MGHDVDFLMGVRFKATLVGVGLLANQTEPFRDKGTCPVLRVRYTLQP